LIWPIQPYFARDEQPIRLSESQAHPYIAIRSTTDLPATMMASRTLLCCLLLLGLTPAAFALTDRVAREQDIVGLRLGQRVMVDDGTCQTGMIKEVSGAKMTPTGVLAARTCVPRSGPKTK
jgi:uncharacterized protein YdbL (DUF1318 family)